jgi:hypothetical protein
MAQRVMVWLLSVDLEIGRVGRASLMALLSVFGAFERSLGALVLAAIAQKMKHNVQKCKDEARTMNWDPAHDLGLCLLPHPDLKRAARALAFRDHMAKEIAEKLSLFEAALCSNCTFRKISHLEHGLAD